MISIRTPESYINEDGILKSSGKYIAKLGRNALIVGGKTALSVAGEELYKSLNSSGVSFKIKEFKGYPTERSIEKYTSIARELGVDLIIGVGGGVVLDLVKAVGEKSNVSVVTVPTIAATCAAWSALSVLYDEDGKHKDYLILNNSPKLVLVDTGVISRAPIRYLNAGIGDTVVKWYEASPHAVEGQKDISLRIGLQTSKLALDILNNRDVSTLNNAIGNNATQDISEVVDSIIILAGLVGSINGGQHRGAIAHALHDSFTTIPDTRESLHGEKVIFGLIVQFILEKKTEKEIELIISFMNSLNLPVTLSQLGINDDIPNKVATLAKGIDILEKELDKLNFEVSTNLIEQAIKKADLYGQNSLKSKNSSDKIA